MTSQVCLLVGRREEEEVNLTHTVSQEITDENGGEQASAVYSCCFAQVARLLDGANLSGFDSVDGHLERRTYQRGDGNQPAPKPKPKPKPRAKKEKLGARISKSSSICALNYLCAWVYEWGHLLCMHWKPKDAMPRGRSARRSTLHHGRPDERFAASQDVASQNEQHEDPGDFA